MLWLQPWLSAEIKERRWVVTFYAVMRDFASHAGVFDSKGTLCPCPVFICNAIWGLPIYCLRVTLAVLDILKWRLRVLEVISGMRLPIPVMNVILSERS
jgi:hypothetical protein